VATLVEEATLLAAGITGTGSAQGSPPPKRSAEESEDCAEACQPSREGSSSRLVTRPWKPVPRPGSFAHCVVRDVAATASASPLESTICPRFRLRTGAETNTCPAWYATTTTPSVCGETDTTWFSLKCISTQAGRSGTAAAPEATREADWDTPPTPPLESPAMEDALPPWAAPPAEPSLVTSRISLRDRTESEAAGGGSAWLRPRAA
jgi:hypothetical protein